MKQLKSCLFLALLACAGILITGCPPEPQGGDGITLEKETLTLTMFSTEKLKYTIKPSGDADKSVTWTSSDPAVVSVTADGTVKALKYTDTKTGTGTAVITVTTEDGDYDTITVTTTMAGQADMMTLPPMKEQFKDFMIGNITSGGYGGSSPDYSGTEITNTRLTKHFNVLTAENIMKPQYYGGTREGNTVTPLTFTGSDAFVNSATASGFKVHGHVLLWHSQNSQWIKDLNAETGNETALALMKDYITQVITHFKGKIHSWDVLNEVFPDPQNNSYSTSDWKNAMRRGSGVGYDNQGANPWYMSIGSNFVYEGFKAARLADPDAILYYNDYNLNSSGKATMVRNMVRDVNDAWTTDLQYDGKLLIEGIGMQSHHNTSVQANAIKTTLDLFKPLGVKISISELDVLCMDWNQFDNSTKDGTGKAGNSTATAAQKLQAANLYYNYFKLFIQYKDIIERVTFWGVNDNASWRSGGLPLLFDGPADNSKSLAKPAYYKVIEALEN